MFALPFSGPEHPVSQNSLAVEPDARSRLDFGGRVCAHQIAGRSVIAKLPKIARSASVFRDLRRRCRRQRERKPQVVAGGPIFGDFNGRRHVVIGILQSISGNGIDVSESQPNVGLLFTAAMIARITALQAQDRCR